MSGHSKWNNIKRKKEKTDAAKAKIFTKIGREISVIVKTGGANPAENSKLKDAIAKAKAANVPNDNIERIIKKAAVDTTANNYEELIYEGDGPCGIAVVVETLGKYSKTLTSGLNFVVPFLEQPRKFVNMKKEKALNGTIKTVMVESSTIDLRETFIDLIFKQVETKDNLFVDIKTVLCYQITNPRKARQNSVA